MLMEVTAIHDIITHFTYSSDNCSHMASRMEEYVLSIYDVMHFVDIFGCAAFFAPPVLPGELRTNTTPCPC